MAIAGGTACVYSAPCPGGQGPNEDAVAVIAVDEKTSILAVADGLGGGPTGERASALALAVLAEAMQQDAGEEQSTRTAILNGIEAANKAVQALGTGAATTLAVAEICDGVVRPYHIGDSMILIVGQRGKIKLQTVSHSPVGFAVESGHLDENEAMQHEDRHIVSNVVGRPDMRIEVGPPLALAARDTVLLASDGLFDNLFVHEVVSIVRRGPIDRAAHTLADETLRHMTGPREGESSKPDDLTFVLYRRTRISS